MNLSLSKADRFAEKIVSELKPLCEKIEVAGSIRRRRPVVGDIDLVILPKYKPAVQARCKRNALKVIMDGEINLIVELSNGVQLDIFFAHGQEKDLFGVVNESTWGTLLLCRTGSKDFNIWIANTAARKGFHWNPYLGIHGHPPSPGEPAPIIASETEEDIFKVLGLDYITPEARER